MATWYVRSQERQFVLSLHRHLLEKCNVPRDAQRAGKTDGIVRMWQFLRFHMPLQICAQASL